MCGITGFYALEKNSIPQLSKIEQSANKLSLRGPDNKSFTKAGNIALGHTRLCIIDTSDKASQPMSDHTGRYIIVFNGEIFNYRELSQKHLSDTWSTFNGPATQSDTEVLLYLLITYGPECLKWLSGFFAFAFYDTQTGDLLLARDRYGKKPLLFFRDKRYIAFASEMKALLEWEIPKELDFTTLYQYLQLNYIPQAQSMLKGVEKLQPGHYLSVNGTSVNTTAYYELEINSSAYGQYSYKDAQARLIWLMNESVKERMISDVPLGAFLSGGIDSSIIVALASAHTKNLKTFSVGYRDNPIFDETSYARLVARKYSTDHTVFSLSNSDFLEHIFEILDYLDEPFADSSAIPTYILCKKTREHVTVALSGDGGDEVFSGYNKHRAEWQIRQKSLLNSLIVSGAPLWKAMPKSHGNKLTNLFRQMDKFASGAKLSIRERYWRWATVSGPETVDLLLSEHFSQQLDGERIREDKNFYLQTLKTDDFNEVLEVDMHLVLPGDMLVKVDQMSMANSLEVRCPFLDHKVVDFAFGLPASFKIDDKYKKKIVQDAFRSMLPEELYNRPKHGFEIPMLGWLRNELWPLIDDLLGKNFIREQKIFDVDGIEQLKKKLRSHDPGNSHALVWALVVFQYWWKKYYS